MEPDDLLCSRNARPQKDAREQPDRSSWRRTSTINRWSLDARSKKQSAYSLWGCWGVRSPSHGPLARLGKSIVKQSEGRAGNKYLPVGGRVRKLRVR